MGSANITPLQGVEIIKTMRVEYEQCVSLSSSPSLSLTPTLSPLSEEEFRERILKKYEQTLSQLQTKSSSVSVPISSSLSVSTINVTRYKRRGSKEITSNSHLPPTSAHVYGGSRSLEARPKAPSRHKSFDGSPTKGKNQIDHGQIETNDEKDSWDSVRGQPACLLCSMVFTSVEKLTTHTKYSTLHASNLKRLENSKFPQADPAAAKLTLTHSSSNHSICDETDNGYRVLYTGSKFFWRSKHNIDFHIYLHLDSNVLEIIGYDSSHQTELSRLYLDEGVVSNCIPESDILERMNLKKESNNKYIKILNGAPNVGQNQSKRLKHATSINEVDETNEESFDDSNTAQVVDVNTSHELDQMLYEDEKRLMIASLLMSKLQYEKVTSQQVVGIATANPITHYHLCFNDPQLQSSVLLAKPPNLTPVSVSRRRHSTQAEITESFRSLNTMQIELQEMTAKAEKMANLMRASLDLFTQHHFPKPFQTTTSTAKYQLSSEEKRKKDVRERWRYAIHKVVLRNALDQTVEMLKKQSTH